MPLPIPWNRIEESISDCQDYGRGGAQVADFFKATEEAVAPDALFQILLDARVGSKWLERFCLALLDARASDPVIAKRALEGARVRRIAMKWAQGVGLEPKEAEIAENLQGYCAGVGGLSLLDALARGRILFQTLMAEGRLPPQEREELVFLIRQEAEALKDRVLWLSENADPYNMKTMARVLPRLRIYDESVQEGLELASRIEKEEPVGQSVLTLEASMHRDGFAKWLGKLEKKPALREWALALRMQQEKCAATLDLLGASTLARWVLEARGEKPDPITWLQVALRAYDQGRVSFEAGDAAEILRPALGRLGFKIDNGKIVGTLREKNLSGLVGRDFLSKPYGRVADEGELDFKAVLAQNITRDSVLEALLNNPKVNQKPGLVGFVALMARSPGVLSMIAKNRTLHTGFANKDVPYCLLQNPSNVPLNLVRPFINTRWVSLMDLKQISRSRLGRPEVRREIDAYLYSRL